MEGGMGNSAVLMLALAGVAILAVAFVFATGRRRDEKDARAHGHDHDRQSVVVGGPSGRDMERSVALERRTVGTPGLSPPPPPPAVPDEETLGVTRRQVLNRGIVTTMLLAISGFGGAMVSMLWPTLSGGFGAKIRVGKVEDVLGEIEATGEPYYVGAGRFYLNPYPAEAVTNAQDVAAYSAVLSGFEAGVVALYQKCPHLGCRVPWCKTSQWFECPCHGSQYNRVGEKKGGPAPRGMDLFVATVESGTVVVDTKLVIPGTPIGVNTTGQESEGPHCIGSTEGGH
ncbi:MAG: ubiquinol-cytochrome c reductase iron-sulfur subunit [Acidimicrobiales bacterium]